MKGRKGEGEKLNLQKVKTNALSGFNLFLIDSHGL
jgi:hypothetical protein